MNPPHTTKHATTPAFARAAQAYLLTVTEAYADRPVFGRTFMADIYTAFSYPAELRAILPPKLRGRFDFWMDSLKTEQLNLFEDA